jgi:mRNA deadenylase 3'-5' endonuclease subunit Ccr4
MNKKVMITHALLAFHHALKITSLHEGIPLIFAGDFNSQPHDMVYNLLCKGWTEGLSQWGWAYLPELQFLNRNTGIIKSAYAEVEGKEPLYTNRVITKHNPRGFQATLDYIFYCGNIQPTSVIPLNLSSSKDMNDYLPNLEEPSDHFMIGSSFKITK